MLKKSGAWGRGVRVDMNKELKIHTVKIAKKVEGGPVQWWGGVQSGSERRIEVIVKMQNEKKDGVGSFLSGGGGVEELKLL